MVSFANPLAPSLSLDALHQRFLVLAPRIESHARVAFRHITCPQRQDDCIAETLALSWRWFLRLAEQGRDAADFVAALATLATRAVKSGRRLAGKEGAKDVLSSVAQRRHGFTVERLPLSTRTSMTDLYGDPQGQVVLDSYEERLTDNTVTPPPDAAAFRIDFPQWLSGWTERDRRIIGDMMRDERTRDVASKYGISPGRIAQLRRAYFEDWNRFHGEGAGACDGRSAGAA
jgi:hypothetical protein